MSSKSTECSLNTTECILKTVVSILNEIQDENNEYNWDPLNFAVTAVIGVIALFFAALAIVQALLTSGPGRTKSGAYAIGAWSRLNDTKFDWVEMRYRTVSWTPVLLARAISGSGWDVLRHIRVRRTHGLPPAKEYVGLEDPKHLKKKPHDYFPAKWLALLTAMQLDETVIWGVKSTGADYIPSDFSTVPAYGSIRFVVTLAIIFGRGYARLTLDPESKLPRVQGPGFNLTFRQHPLLGAVGLFETHVAVLEPTSQGPNELQSLILYANGYMEFPAFNTLEAATQQISMRVTYAGELDWKYADFSLSNMFLEGAEEACLCNNQNAVRSQRCCGLSPASWPASCGLLRQLLDQNLTNFNIVRWGPLYPLIADRPRSPPLLFPRTKIRFREKLVTLFLQSRFWAMMPSSSWPFSPEPLGSFSADQSCLVERAMSWATTVANGPVMDLELSSTAWTLASNHLTVPILAPGGAGLDMAAIRTTLESETVAIDTWLKNAGSLVLCRQMTLGIIGHAIQEVMLNARPGAVNSAIVLDHIKFPIPRDNLARFLYAVGDPNLEDCLFHGVVPTDAESFDRVKGQVCQLLFKIRDLWETGEVQEVANGDEAGGEPQWRSVWKVPNTNQHPLDDLLIYRAVLISLLYSLSIDSSHLLEDDSYGLVVPIM